MDLILKNLAHVTKIISWLDLRKVFLLTFAGLVALVLYTGYEQRARFFQSIEVEGILASTKFVVSTEMQDKIKLLVERSENIIAINVLTSNLRINEREIVYRYNDNVASEEALKKYYAERGLIQPIFTKDDENNAQMVAAINGEFTCGPYKSTLDGSVLIPGLTNIKSLCRISLPPYYGEFAGYISIALKREPDEVEKLELELEARKLANELFFKNIVKR